MNHHMIFSLVENHLLSEKFYTQPWTVFLMSSLSSGFGKGLQWADQLIKLKPFSNDSNVHIVATVPSQVPECILLEQTVC